MARDVVVEVGEEDHGERRGVLGGVCEVGGGPGVDVAADALPEAPEVGGSEEEGDDRGGVGAGAACAAPGGGR